MSAVTLSTLRPEEAPLVTMHLSAAKYPCVERVCKYMQQRGYPAISFDAESRAIHFQYAMGAIGVMLCNSLPNYEEYIPTSIINTKAFTKTDSGLLSEASSNGTKLEIHTQKVSEFCRGAKKAILPPSFDASFQEMLEIERANCTREDVPPSLSKEDIMGAKAMFENNTEKLLSQFESMDQFLSRYTLEEVQELANVAEGVVNTPYTITVPYTTEPLHEFVKQQFDTLRQEWENAQIEAEKNYQRELVQVRKKMGLEGHFLEEEENTESHLNLSPKSTEPNKEPISAKMDELTVTGTMPSRRLRKEEELALHLKEKGSLTVEKFALEKSQVKKGIQLLHKLQSLKKQEDKVHETLQMSMGDPKNKIRSLFESLLEKYPGICFAEHHKDTDPKKLLIENMKALAKTGVRTLFLEGLSYDLHQPMLDAYFAQKSGPMPKQLREWISLGDAQNGLSNSPYSILNLVQASKRAGIRVVGIETQLTEHACDPNLLNDTSARNAKDNFFNLRVETMNYAAMQIIQEVQQQNPQEKYIVLTGASHSIEDNGIPGLNTLLQIPTIASGSSCVDDFSPQQPETSKSYDVFYFPVPENPPTYTQRARQVGLSLKTIDKKIRFVKNQIKDLERLVKKTNKAARLRKNSLNLHLDLLKNKYHSLMQKRTEILSS